MKHTSVRRRIAPVVLFLLAAPALFSGCKDSSLSQAEVKQMKSGPPAEMPAEGRAAMQKSMQSPPIQATQGPNGR